MTGENAAASASRSRPGTTGAQVTAVSSPTSSKPGSFACMVCHKNKRKCDGKRPSCSLCLKRRVTCLYPSKKPSVAVEDRLERLEQLITNLLEREERTEGYDQPGDTRPTHRDGRNRTLDQPPGRSSLQRVNVDVPPSPINSGWGASPLRHRSTGGVPVRQPSRTAMIPEQRSQPFHNPSSLYSLPSPTSSSSHLPPASAYHRDQNASLVRSRLVENARTQRDEEEAVLFIYTLNLPEAPMDLYAYLLDSYWTWIHPMFNMVYRPAFCRGMSELTTPYFNSFLFYALMSFSTHFCKDHEAMVGHQHLIELFHSKSRTLLVEELDKPSSIATSQGLLLLSAIENTKGNTSQGWNFAGMAFRMVQDLGIHLDSAEDVSRTTDDPDVDLEVRKRLWWSAYLWDKMISVYVGRTPMLQQTLLSSPQVIMDDSTEDDPWIPIGFASPTMVHRSGHEVSTFIMACKAAVIMNRALLRFYCDGAEPILDQSLAEDEALMRDSVDLLRTMPLQLRIEHDQTVPTHLSHLCCLIHAVIILTHRPYVRSGFWRHPSISDQCQRSAESILEVIETEQAAYGIPRFTIAAWTLWTATGVFLLQLRSSEASVVHDEVSAKIQACRSLLLGMATYHPSLHRSVSILDDQLVNLGRDINVGDAGRGPWSLGEEDPGMPSLHLFAFPQVFETSFQAALR